MDREELWRTTIERQPGWWIVETQWGDQYIGRLDHKRWFYPCTNHADRPLQPDQQDTLRFLKRVEIPDLLEGRWDGDQMVCGVIRKADLIEYLDQSRAMLDDYEAVATRGLNATADALKASSLVSDATTFLRALGVAESA